MKILGTGVLLVGLAMSSQAQFFNNNTLGGALLGGIAGGVIGHNNNRQTAEGVAIGAGAGLLLGALANEAQQGYYGRTQVPRPTYSGYGMGYSSYPVHPGYGYGCVPQSGFSYSRFSRPNYTWSGAALGGLAGGIIGHNSGRRTAEGIAIGAGTGLLLGHLADRSVQRRSWAQPTPVVVNPPMISPVQPATVFAPSFTSPTVRPTTSTPQVGNVTIINNYYGNSSSMGSANSLFGR